jgi:hypothetical protein
MASTDVWPCSILSERAAEALHVDSSTLSWFFLAHPAGRARGCLLKLAKSSGIITI